MADKTIIFSISFFFLFLCIFFIVMLITWNKRSISNLRRQHALAQDTQRKLLKATIAGQELERKVIAENLHDDIGPLLSSLKLQVRNRSNDPDFQANFSDTLDLAVGEIRRVSQRLSPLIFEELGLNKAVRYVSDEFVNLSGIALELNWDDRIQDQLNQERKLAIFRILQEALNNVVKHAGAKQVTITAAISEDGRCLIDIQDDGCGIQGGAEARLGLGMNSMMARAESMDATFAISSTGRGTCLTLTIPIG
ncbi:MAG: hypothetical protein H6568_08570 [Lewinellaceae bacterium]|nr:hypothetical protein [Saprospiraceae bacterium]MCB9312807.1 hypothetical protein [Lewinellaceae bacterium]